MQIMGLQPVCWLEKIPTLFKDRWQAWLNLRLPPSRRVHLNRHNVFIFPTRSGFFYLLFLVLLGLLATNYENNLIFALMFLLAGLFVVSIVHTFNNLSGLVVTATGCRPAFVGEDAEFDVLLQRLRPHPYENLSVNFQNSPAFKVDLIEKTQQRAVLYVPAEIRGWMDPGRLRIETCYPLGLLRAWSILDLDIKTLVYPKPVKTGPVPPASGRYGEGALTSMTGSDDFYGLKAYQPGESLRRIAWKHFAQGRGLLSKEYVATADRQVWLDWDYLAGQPLESRLSRLCYWVMQLHQSGDEYGLRLPGVEIQPDKGARHQEQVLKVLALFEPKNLC